ncbi:MAG: HlyD family efflux transporter periplasmic adaptor subunit [Pseudobutyrivibrio sp.]|nr:HlyD family efflux transporter periplasmic adaptor subunit [Pseudobutyrivibrio sp.]
MKKALGFVKKHKKLVILIVVIALIAAYVIYAKNKADEMLAQLQAQANAALETQVDQMDLTTEVKVTGTLSTVDFATVSSSMIGSEVKEVFFEQGDYVNEGDLIVQMDDSSAKDNLNVTYATANTANFSSEQQVVVTSRNLANAQRDYDEHYAQYGKEMEDLYLAWVNLQDVNNHKEEDPGRYNEEWSYVIREHPDWAMTKGDIDSVEAAYDRARAKFEGLSTNLTDAQYAWEIANASQKQSSTSNNVSIKSGKRQVDNAAITAPMSGYITSLNVSAGDIYSQTSGSLFTISDTSAYKIDATVDQYDIANIELGMKCVVKFDSTGEEEFAGTLSYVALMPKEAAALEGMGTSGSSSVEYPIEITLDKPSDKLRVGMTAKARIIIEEKKNALCVPYDCVREDDDGRQYLVAVAEDGSTYEIDVTTGLEADYYIEVIGKDIKKGIKVQAVSSGSEYETLMDMISSEASISVVSTEE